MARMIPSTDGKYIIIEKDIDGVPALILMPKDYCETDRKYFKMGGFELFNLVETYADYINVHKSAWNYIKNDNNEPYEWELK